MGLAGRRAGDEPAAIGELLALLPIRQRPDVLGVRGAGPGEAAQQRGVARDRGRSVQEVRVQMRDLYGELGGKDERLAEAADAAPRRITRQIREPGAPR